MPRQSKTAATKKKAAAPKRARKPSGKAEGAGRRLRIRQVKSGIGHPSTYRRSLEALGLKHHQHEIVVTDSPSVQGMLRKLHHLVRVVGEES